jgi:transcription antitermination factor NusG
MKKWWAARVLTGKEYQIKKAIKNHSDDCEIYIPRKLTTDIKDGRLEQKTENLLPGYILIGTEKDFGIGNIEGFVKIIGTITEEEFERIKQLEYIESNDGVLRDGARIIINDGPFIGCKGTVVSVEDDMVNCRLIFQNMDIYPKIKNMYVNTI